MPTLCRLAKDRLADMLRQRRCRKRKKLLARKARLEEKMQIVTEKLKVVQERVAKKALDMRKNATAHQGTIDGFGAETPLDEAQLIALHFAKRYCTAYLDAVAEKKRWLAAMSKQQAPVIQPRIIQL